MPSPATTVKKVIAMIIPATMSSLVSLDNLILPYIININQKRNYILNAVCWFRTTKIYFRNDELKKPTMTNYESKTIQNKLL